MNEIPQIKNNYTESLRFGVLMEPLKISVDDIFSITPVENFQSTVELIEKASDNNVVIPELCDPRNDVRNSFRVYKIPSTHIITSNLIIDRDEFMRNEGAMILGLLGVIYDSRSQWEDWWHEGQVRITQQECAGFWKYSQVAEIFSKAFSKWNNFSKEQRDLFLNALFYHQKAIGYAYGFEVFFANYIAIDAIWKLREKSSDWPKIIAKKRWNHDERIRVMMTELRMVCSIDPQKWEADLDKYKAQLVQKITSDRNNLFHEGVWGERRGVLSGKLGESQRNMHEFVKRLLIAALGISNGFTNSTWDVLQRVSWS